MHCLERKFGKKVVEKVSKEIQIKQVELSTLINDLEKLFTKVNTLFFKLCNFIHSYYKTIMETVDKIDVNLLKENKTLILDESSSSVYFTQINCLQGKQSKQLHEEFHIQDEVTSIQAWLLPHMELMQRHLQTTKDLIKNQHLSTYHNMVNIVAMIEFEKNVLETLKTNWDNTMAIIIRYMMLCILFMLLDVIYNITCLKW